MNIIIPISEEVLLQALTTATEHRMTLETYLLMAITRTNLDWLRAKQLPWTKIPRSTRRRS